MHTAYDPFAVPLYAAYPDRRYMPASLSAFLELVTTEFRSAKADPATAADPAPNATADPTQANAAPDANATPNAAATTPNTSPD